MFHSVMHGLSGQLEQLANEHVDEMDLVEQHKNFFGGSGGAPNATPSGMGAASAMQALKMFTGGQQAAQVGQGPAGAQNAFVGMAMGEAAKLFESQSSQGNMSSGTTKNEVVQQAAKTALKMFMQGGGGAGGTGGPSGLMGLASKFM
jgi:hypothetical protein